MTVPTYVKAITAFTAVLIVPSAIRNVVAPGVALPFPPMDATNVKALWPDVSKPTIEGQRSRFLCQIVGLLWVGFFAIKLTTIFSHPEGTFLRRNLMIVCGMIDVAAAAVMQTFSQVFADGLGVNATPFVAVFLIEGAALLFDAIARKRPAKKAKK